MKRRDFLTRAPAALALTATPAVAAVAIQDESLDLHAFGLHCYRTNDRL